MKSKTENELTVKLVIDENLKNWLNSYVDKDVSSETSLLGIVDDILSALRDRGGFDDWWNNLYLETRIEILDELEEIVKSYL